MCGWMLAFTFFRDNDKMNRRNVWENRKMVMWIFPDGSHGENGNIE